MNSEMIFTILSILGNLPITNQAPFVPDNITAVYAEWVDTATVTVACPDPNSGIDPMGQAAVVSRTMPSKDGGTVSVSMPVLLVPESQTCDRFVYLPNHTIFPTMMDAGEFRLKCAIGQCLEWKTRQASDLEVVQYALTKRGWQIYHYPGGDASKYPKGVFEVFPVGEKTFENPISQGSSPLEAISIALQKGGE